MEFSALLGKTLVKVEVTTQYGNDCIIFTDSTGQKYEMYHDQDCCETVDIESVVGDWNDLLGHPLLMAEEAVSGVAPEQSVQTGYSDESETWTFYKLATVKGYVDIRWYGTSNGSYSESVYFRVVEQ